MAESAHPPLRLVLDTNIVVAGLLWNGLRRWLLEAAIAGEVELYSSAVLLAELAHTLGYAKFAARIDSFGTAHRGAGGAVHRARQPGGAGQRAARGRQRRR